MSAFVHIVLVFIFLEASVSMVYWKATLGSANTLLGSVVNTWRGAEWLFRAVQGGLLPRDFWLLRNI